MSTSTRDPHLVAISEALSAPFEVREIKFKPKMVKNNRALAMAYIDARLIQDRLDQVLGVENWQDNYDLLPDGSVICRLKLKLGNRWITKTDVGSPSEQPDSGDRLKAAFSDALKRAAVKFGIGRYLYRLPAQWVDYDPVKKQLTQLPQLPDSALPSRKPSPSRTTESLRQPPAAGAQKVQSLQPPKLPASGSELLKRLEDFEAKLMDKKLCTRGALLAHVAQAGARAGYAASVMEWTQPAIAFAVDVARDFEQTMRKNAGADPKQAA